MNDTDNKNDNNNVVLAGAVAEVPVYSHEIFGESFYVFDMNVPRISGIMDTVPVMISERIFNIESIKIGNLYEVIGQFRSYNKQEERKNRLLLSVFVTEIRELEEEFTGKNKVMIEGFICKETVYRQTPLGREICDLLLAVNRLYRKSDYIPCIVWGRNATYLRNMEIGTHLHCEGRIQSRNYLKDGVKRIAYEVSIASIKCLDRCDQNSKNYNDYNEQKECRMAKKRNCRRTVDEDKIHEKAVKIRKMTDEQLIQYVEDRVEKARSEGFNKGKEQANPVPKIDMKSIIEEISNVRGISATKLQDIRSILEKRLMGNSNA